MSNLVAFTALGITAANLAWTLWRERHPGPLPTSKNACPSCGAEDWSQWETGEFEYTFVKQVVTMQSRICNVCNYKQVVSIKC